MKMFEGTNQCFIEQVQKNGIKEEVKHMFDRIFTDKWVMIVENGSKEQYESELAGAINPLVEKLMGING